MVACEQQFSAFLSLSLGTAGGSLRKLLPWIPGRHTLLLLLLTRWPFLLVSLAGLSKHCGAENSALSPLLSICVCFSGSSAPGAPDLESDGLGSQLPIFAQPTTGISDVLWPSFPKPAAPSPSPSQPWQLQVCQVRPCTGYTSASPAGRPLSRAQRNQGNK